MNAPAAVWDVSVNDPLDASSVNEQPDNGPEWAWFLIWVHDDPWTELWVHGDSTQYPNALSVRSAGPLRRSDAGVRVVGDARVVRSPNWATSLSVPSLSNGARLDAQGIIRVAAELAVSRRAVLEGLRKAVVERQTEKVLALAAELVGLDREAAGGSF
jgi:hypothetical protein